MFVLQTMSERTGSGKKTGSAGAKQRNASPKSAGRRSAKKSPSPSRKTSAKKTDGELKSAMRKGSGE